MCIILVSGSETGAQNLQDSTFLIPEVVVSKQRQTEVIPSQQLNGKTLESLSSFSVADAIRYFSGIQVKDYGGIGGLKTVDIRSMGTNHMGVFYDGIQLGNAQNGQVDLGKFSLDNIEEISLYNGQKSEIFQSAKDFSNSGSIYLRSRKPLFKTDKNVHLKGVFRSGSFDLLNPSILLEYKASKRIAANFNVEYLQSSGKYKFRYRRSLAGGKIAYDTSAIRENGDIEAIRIESGLFGAIQGGEWNAKMYYYDSKRGIPGPIVNNVWKHAQRQWDKNLFTQSSWQKAISEKQDILVNLKFSNDYMRYLNPDTTLLHIDNSFWQQEVYASMANRYGILKSWNIALSFDFQWNALQSNMKNFVHPTRLTTLIAAATGVRMKQVNIQGSLLATFIHDKVGLGSANANTSNAATPDKHELTPAIFFSYTPFEHSGFQLLGFYKDIFRMPTFNDLYYTDIGNISLKPEYTKQFNLGFQLKKETHRPNPSRIDFQGHGYFNQVSNKIVAIPKGNSQYRWMMMNLGYVEIRGLDLSNSMEWNLPAHITLHTKVNYTFQKAQDLTNPKDNDPKAGSYGSQIAYIPKHNGSAIVNLSKNTWTANYSFIYVGERYHNSSNIPANYEPSWYTHDFTLTKVINIHKQRFTCSAELNNMLNQSYDVVLNYPMPGRNFKLILKIEL